MVSYLRVYKFEMGFKENGISIKEEMSVKKSKTATIAEMEVKIDELEWEVITLKNLLDGKTEEAKKSHSNNAALRKKIEELECVDDAIWWIVHLFQK